MASAINRIRCTLSIIKQCSYCSVKLQCLAGTYGLSMSFNLNIFDIIFSGLGRFAGILSLEVEDPSADLSILQSVGTELAMHVVAAKPLFLSRELVSSDALENEREILRSQVQHHNITTSSC